MFDPTSAFNPSTADSCFLASDSVDSFTGIARLEGMGGTASVERYIDSGFTPDYGYGLVNAAAAVARASGDYSAFPDFPDMGGYNWGNDMVGAQAAWNQGYTGAGVTVAVIDTGVDYTHPDLDSNIWVNSGEIANDGIDNDGNGYVDDSLGWNFVDDNNDPMDTSDSGHGTHVSGTIAAENNGFGVTGVAYDAKIMALKALGPDGGSNADIAEAIYYAVNNGAQVINLSLGSSSPSEEIAAALAYAASNNVITVSASGNDGNSTPSYPGAYATDYGLVVGAVDRNGNVADFSNDAGTDRSMQFVVAPGVDVYSTLPGNNYGSLDGTSMASPHVAGVAALMLSANPDLTPDVIRSIITETATVA